MCASVVSKTYLNVLLLFFQTTCFDNGGEEKTRKNENLSERPTIKRCYWVFQLESKREKTNITFCSLKHHQHHESDTDRWRKNHLYLTVRAQSTVVRCLLPDDAVRRAGLSNGLVDDLLFSSRSDRLQVETRSIAHWYLIGRFVDVLFFSEQSLLKTLCT